MVFDTGFFVTTFLALLVANRKSSRILFGNPGSLFFWDPSSPDLGPLRPKRWGSNFEFTGSPSAPFAALSSDPKGLKHFLALCSAA